MTKLTNEELRQALEEIRMIASGETEPKDGEDAEDALVTIDDICKRMAEGAAGEASPQGDLLAALRAERELCCKDVCACCQWPETWQEAALMPNGDGNPDSSPEYVHTFRPQIGSGTSRPIFKRCEANAIRSRVPEQAQAKTTSAESGFASTAGPRPRCPNALTEENLAAINELEREGQHRNWTTMELVEVHQALANLLKEVRFHRAQFFAAAPAGDTKEKIND